MDVVVAESDADHFVHVGIAAVINDDGQIRELARNAPDGRRVGVFKIGRSRPGHDEQRHARLGAGVIHRQELRIVSSFK